MFDLLDKQTSLTVNQWKIFTTCLLSIVIDFFDFALIAFVLAFFVNDWHLTFGQSGAILFASGVGAIPGAMIFGWLGDRIGRRKVFMAMVLTLSFATGAMALTPERNWLFMAAMRLVVGLAVGGLGAIDLPLLQEFMPAAKRGWISGLSTGLLPLGPLAAAAVSASLGPVIGWRGLFALGLVPALLAFVIRLWVPESPRWLFQKGRLDEARRAVAWALQCDPAAITLPAVLPEARKSAWSSLFRHPRSIAAAVLAGLSQTGAVGVGLWGVAPLVLVLHVSPAKASYLTAWLALVGIPGRVFGAWVSEAFGRRFGGTLTSLLAALAMALAGYLHDAFLGAFSIFYLMLLLHSFFSAGNFSVVFPYMAELWPVQLRASGFGLVYGVSNLGKFIGPAGLALLAGVSNYVSPQATLAAIVPAFTYFAIWYLLAVVAFAFIGIETRGRTIDEIDAALAHPSQTAASAR